MEFDVKPKGAGSAGAILQDPSVQRVYGLFGDGCLKYYKLDIRTTGGKRNPYLSAAAMRQVKSFIDYYGEDDAYAIIETLFGVMHEGRFKGQPLGNGIFSSSKRWMSDQLLLEASSARQGVSTSNGPEQHTIGGYAASEVRIKSALV